jgi:outer membrane translocation and assembly module TamA
LDYRFPILGPVGGNLFVDSGNVWADWRNIDFSEMKTGVGIGARYMSPVGLVRLDVGWKLDREALEDSYVIFFSFGNPF